MYDFEGVKDADADHELLADLGGVVLVEVLVVLDKLEEVLALDEFHEDVDVSLGLNALLELEEEGVGHYLHDGTLMAESADCTLLGSWPRAPA